MVGYPWAGTILKVLYHFMPKYELFPNYIGQDKLKNKLSFLLHNHRKTKIFQPVLLVSERGSGKSTLARQIGDNLLDFKNERPRKFLEINAASVKNIGSLIDDIIVPYVAGDKEITIFFDEFGEINEKVANWLLSVLCPNKGHVTSAIFNGVKYDFNYQYISFICATTDARLLSLPMKSRLRRLDFESYSFEDLTRILFQNAPGISFTDQTENEIVQILRGSPRATVMMAEDIRQYLASSNKDTFDFKDWRRLKKILDILPLGLNRNELQMLKYLNERAMTLTCLAAKCNITASECRNDRELFLLSEGLINIDGKRKITPKGQDLLKLSEIY